MKSLMGHRRPPRGFSRIEDKEKRIYFHVLQVDPKDSYGWFDEMISRDYGKVYKEKLLLEKDVPYYPNLIRGKVYKEKKILEKDVPDYRYRIVVKSSTKKWKEIKDAFER
mgnify:CR=1 FL=1